MEGTPSEEVLEELGIPPGVLTEREALVLALRMGFVDGKAHTLEEVAAFLGAPPEWVRSVETTALAKAAQWKERGSRGQG